MATPLLIRNFISAGVSKHTVVEIAADAAVKTATGGTKPVIGVAAELDAAAGERVDVVLAGTAPVRFGAAVTAGAILASDTTGRAVPAAAGNRTIGIALEAGAAGEIGEVLLAPGHEPA